MKRLPTILIVLLSAMLIGLVGHGFEIFEKVEGQDWIGVIKAVGFPLALEVGNAAGLYVLASHLTKGFWTRVVGGAIGVICLVFSFLLQYTYYRFRVDFDWLYSFALPILAALIAVLIGFLDKDNSEPQELVNPTTEADNQLLEELKAALKHMADNQQTLSNQIKGIWDKVIEIDKREPTIIQQLVEPAKVAGTSTPSLTTEDRRAEIAKLLQGSDKLNKTLLARQFNVSIPTINNDLAWIEKQ